MNRFRLWSFAASLLLACLWLTACTGSPAGSNTNSAGPKPADTAKNSNGPAATPAPSAAGYEGFQDDINCNNLIGWAWDSRRPNEAVKLEIYDGNSLLTTINADTFRQDLLDAHKGNGAHAFTYALPAQLRDGKPHTIRVKIAGADADLAQTSKTITCKNE